MLRCKSPSSISIITSFFLVKGLKGTLTFSFNKNSEGIKLPHDNEQDDNKVSSSFLSKVGEASLNKLFEGQFQNNTATLGGGAGSESSNNNGNNLVEAAAGRQMEYLHCLLMNLHCPVVKNVFLLVENQQSAEFLQEILLMKSTATTTKANNNLFAEKQHKLVPVIFNPASPSRVANNNQNQFKNLEQPLYSDFFSLATQMLHPTNDVAAICNSDIHFHTKQMVEDADVRKWFHHRNYDAEKMRETVMALTRYEEDVSSFHFNETKTTKKSTEVKNNNTLLEPRDVTVAPLVDDYRGSHDAFLFRPKVISEDFIQRVAHPQNAYQSENVVIDSFEKMMMEQGDADGADHQKTQYRLCNPCVTGGFRIAHKHESEVRQWYPPLNDGRYGKVQPE